MQRKKSEASKLGFTTLSVLVLAALLSLFAAPAANGGLAATGGEASGESAVEKLTALDWHALFEAHGSDLAFGASLWDAGELFVLEDNISDGRGIDMSVLSGESIVYNGTVDAPHDLGNAYGYVAKDDQGRRLIYVGVERLAATSSPGDTFVEFEFNQGVVHVTSGVPWPIYGDRMDGDVVFRLNIRNGILSSVEISLWENGAFRLIDSENVLFPAVHSCGGLGDVYVFCSRSPIKGLPPDDQETYDAVSQSIVPPPPDNFLEVGINVPELLGSDREFSSLVLRTPQDVILGFFRSMGYWRLVRQDREAEASRGYLDNNNATGQAARPARGDTSGDGRLIGRGY